jgi:DNA helicase-2/ATP-dependent DNA helicase PcrA
MFSIFGADKSSIKTPADKSAWAREMDKLISLCMDGSIGDVLEHLKAATQIPFPESLLQVDRDLARIGNTQVEGEPSACTQLRNMLPIRYREVTALLKFIEGYTPFETKHGVKGAEFENVVVVFGRGWNQYNFGQFLEWNGHPPPDKTDAYERNRNLFYVVCSRPKQRLALLFTQKLSSGALSTLAAWFGNKEIHSLPNHA